MDILPLIQRRTARVGVIGLGLTGLPLAVAAARARFSVTGFDMDLAKRQTLDAGGSYVNSVSPVDLQAVKDHFDWSTKFSRLANMNVIAICVQPRGDDGTQPAEETLQRAGSVTVKHIKPGTLVLLDEASCPDKLRAILEPSLSNRGLVPDKTVFLGTARKSSTGGPEDGRAAELTRAFWDAIA